MKRLIVTFLCLGVILSLTSSESTAGQRRRVVVRSRPHRTTIVVRRNHPVRRRLPATVVVRPARKVVTVGAPLVFLPPLAWIATAATLPPRERLVWEDSEVIESDEGWVDANFGIDASGNALFLKIDGRAELNFAEVAFANGNVQVVDFNERTHGDGLYKLLDFADGRHVKTVRLLALSKSKETRLVVYLNK